MGRVLGQSGFELCSAARAFEVRVLEVFEAGKASRQVGVPKL